MAGAVVNCLDLIKRTFEISQALADQYVSQTLNDIQISNCKRLVKDVDQELESHGHWLSKLTYINVPKTGLAKLTLSQSKSLVTYLEVTLGQIEAIKQHASMETFPTTLKVLLDEFRNQFEDLKAKLEKLVAIITELYEMQNKDDVDASSHIDNFVFTNMVQPNPLHVFLDFQSKETPECNLKDAIFQEGPDKTVSAVASGMGGIGKTCALRGVGMLEEAKSRFPGGILYMSLGAEAGKHELIHNFAKFVKQSGGNRASVEIGREDNIASAVTLTAKWFEDHSTLFLIDDVWCTKGIDSTVTDVLAGLARNNRSRVAFTTRDRTVRSHVKIRFKKRGDNDAKKILLQSSGCTSVSESTNEYSAFQYLLNISDGLPIALGVIGKRAKYLVEERDVDELKVWELVREEFAQPDDLLLEDASRDMKNEKVLNVLRRSLEMAGNEKSGENLIDQFACLSVLRKRQETPVDVLDRMWGIGSRKSKRQIEMLERFSIVEIQHWFQGKIRMCFVVHDLFLDISRNLAHKKDGFRVAVCTRLLSSYVPNKNSFDQNKNVSSEQSEYSKKKTCGGFISRINRDWKWKKQEAASSSDEQVTISKSTGELERSRFHEAWVTVRDDGFARRNVFRLLDIAGRYDEGIAMILDPRWVTAQVNRLGRKQFNEDAAIILKHVEQNELRERYAGCAKAIRMVQAAVIDSELHTSYASTAGALWSQLYGRLINLSSYDYIAPFVNAIDEFAPAPLVRSQGVLPVPTASVEKVMDISNVLFLRGKSDCIEIVSSNDEQSCLHLRRFFPDEDYVHLWKTWSIPHELSAISNGAALSRDSTTLAIISGINILIATDQNSRGGTCTHNLTTLSQHKGEVNSISISADGKSLISGGHGGEVFLWRFTDSVWEETQLEGHTEDVLSVRMCPDGNKAVSGGKDMTVRLWTKFEGRSWVSEMLTGHCNMISSIDLSDDGQNVVAASIDNIHVWERLDSEWVSSRLDEHSSLINDVAVEANSMRIVSASMDSTARVWECREGVWSCMATLEGHRGWVMCAAIGANRDEIITSSINGSMRMWNIGRDRWEADALRGHTSEVEDVAVSGDGRRVVSGSRGGEVLLWEKCASSWRVHSLKKHPEAVTAVAISSRGRLVMSGSSDRTACVFEEKNRRWTSQELTGHIDSVRDVAISLDERVLATASRDKTVNVWIKIGHSWKLIDTLDGHSHWVNSVALNRDGSLVVSGSHDQTVRVWDLRRGGCTAVQTLSGYEEVVTAVAITLDGSTIASGDCGGTVTVWAQLATGRWDHTAIENFDHGRVKKISFSTNGCFLRADYLNRNLLWFAQRGGAWAEDTTRSGASATDRGAFGDGRLDRCDWPFLFKELLGPLHGQAGRLWSFADGWYFVQLDTAPFAEFLQLVK